MLAKCCVVKRPATAALHPLSLHDALPIFPATRSRLVRLRGVTADNRARRATAGGKPRKYHPVPALPGAGSVGDAKWRDRKSTRLNSSHVSISYAVFCLKKKMLELSATKST